MKKFTDRFCKMKAYLLTTQQVCAILCINVDLSTSKIIQRT